jgi:hypothetical protein
MEAVIINVFYMIAFLFFGLVMEILTNALKKVAKYGWTKETIKLEGSVSLWMAPVYALLLTFVFMPLSDAIRFLPAWIQFFIYAPSFSSIECGLGWFFEKVFGVVLWDYSEFDDVIYKYTRIQLFWCWGLAGLWLSSYVTLLKELAPAVVKFFT